MFSSPRFLAYVNKPSPYYLRSSLTDDRRMQILKIASSLNTRQVVSASNPIYKRANQLMKQQKIDNLQKYQNSFMWSPKYTPNNFIYSFLIPGLFVVLLGLYIRFVAWPSNMMDIKRKYGVRFHQTQSLGFFDGWYDQYIKKDKVLQFEAYTLGDLQRLHKQGMLAKTPEQTITKIQKKKSKFLRGDRDFVMSQFKTT